MRFGDGPEKGQEADGGRGCETELQVKYTNFKNSLTQLASKIGEVENEAEEHQYVYEAPFRSYEVFS